jgi:hypothetical protein
MTRGRVSLNTIQIHRVSDGRVTEQREHSMVVWAFERREEKRSMSVEVISFGKTEDQDLNITRVV